jgi:putative addiction module component (TIGR02574 family)
MSAKIDTVFAAAMELSEDERIELADRLFTSVTSERQEEVDRLWAEEAERRLQSLRDGTAKSVPWEQVRDSLLNRAQK